MRWLARIPRPVRWIGGFLAAAAVAGFLAIWIGLAPIAASSGHWKITAWVLHFAMRNAVELRATQVEAPPPDLDADARVLRGAGHYASGCAPCHGAPGMERSAVARSMTPKPPYLPPDVSAWSDNELFWIVRNGVKFTAMPAWPAVARTEEVWDMVAFLRRLPDMTPEAYRRLAGLPEPAAGTRLRALTDPVGALVEESCARCHGTDGQGRGAGAFPVLAGQREAYLLASLEAYAQGRRHSGFMQPVAGALTADERAELAAFYAAKAPPEAAPAEGDVAVGEAIAEAGIIARGVPACRHCHGPGMAPRAALYPDLAGQPAAYLELQLHAFSRGVRGGTEFSHIMEGAAHRLEPEEAAAVAAWYSALPHSGP